MSEGFTRKDAARKDATRKDPAACCAFCGKHLPVVNGEVQPWRAADGQFFCNEFCADDSEEVRFRRHGRAERKAHERDFFF
jgi:hypothetical protein